MNKFIRFVAMAATVCAPAIASAQTGVLQTIGAWRLLPLGESCVLSTEAAGQELELDGLKTGGGITLGSPAIAKLSAGTKVAVALDLGSAGIASLTGTVTSIGGENMLLIGLKADVLLTHLRPLSRLKASIGGTSVFDAALPQGSGPAYDAFARCSAAL